MLKELGNEGQKEKQDNITIPHDLLKSRISDLVHNAFRTKDGSVRYTHTKVTRAKGHFTHDINGGRDNMYTADNICKTRGPAALILDRGLMCHRACREVEAM